MTSRPPAIVQNLTKLIGTARDGALLRFSSGYESLKSGDAAQAAAHWRAAVATDPVCSPRQKRPGRALTQSGDIPAALEVHCSGLDSAKQKGDKRATEGGKQAAKEMTVFAQRLLKQNGQNGEKVWTCQ